MCSEIVVIVRTTVFHVGRQERQLTGAANPLHLGRAYRREKKA
jgi:hypothetical protein